MMLKGETYIQVSRQDFGRRICLDLAMRDDRGLHIVRDLVIETVPPDNEDGGLYRPSIQMDGRVAQQLLDELWRAGFRPAGNSADSSLHLADMRTIAFALLKKEGADVPTPTGP